MCSSGSGNNRYNRCHKQLRPKASTVCHLGERLLLQDRGLPGQSANSALGNQFKKRPLKANLSPNYRGLEPFFVRRLKSKGCKVVTSPLRLNLPGHRLVPQDSIEQSPPALGDGAGFDRSLPELGSPLLNSSASP